MVNDKLRQYLADYYYDSLILDNPSFDNSIIGVSTDGKLLYDFKKMIDELVDEEDMTEEEAVDFIEYNTIRAIGYFDSDFKPIIIGERFK